MDGFFESCQQTATLGPRIASGGQGSVHEHPFDPNSVVKKYNCPTAEQAAKLRAIIVGPPRDPPPAGGSVHFFPPKDLITHPADPAQVLGYEMELAENFTTLVRLCNPAVRPPGADPVFLLRVARNICCGVAALHDQGIVIGDLRPSNILVGPQGEAWFIDCDSYQFQSGSVCHHCGVGRPEFMAPELHGVALDRMTLQPSHDRFALAIVLFMLLTDGSHPYAASYRGSGGRRAPLDTRIKEGWWPYATQPTHPYRPRPHSRPFYKRLATRLQRLFDQCFAAGHSDPDKRPSANDWHVAVDVILSAKRFLRILMPNPMRVRISLPHRDAALAVLNAATRFLSRSRVPLQYVAVLLLGLLLGITVCSLRDWCHHDSRSSSNINDEETSGRRPTPRLWKDLAEGRR